MIDVRFMYIRGATWEPSGCIAIRVRRSLNRAEYGLSVCNPVDAMDSKGHRLPFDRKKAQALATRRLDNEIRRCYITSDATQHEITKAVLGDIIASGFGPSRAVRFAKKWIDMADCIYG